MYIIQRSIISIHIVLKKCHLIMIIWICNIYLSYPLIGLRNHPEPNKILLLTQLSFRFLSADSKDGDGCCPVLRRLQKEDWGAYQMQMQTSDLPVLCQTNHVCIWSEGTVWLLQSALSGVLSAEATLVFFFLFILFWVHSRTFSLLTFWLWMIGLWL